MKIKTQFLSIGLNGIYCSDVLHRCVHSNQALSNLSALSTTTFTRLLSSMYFLSIHTEFIFSRVIPRRCSDQHFCSLLIDTIPVVDEPHHPVN